jgi:murein DD-endopeptidase MepM/ murein hydrolase activator NlpD
MARPKWTKRIVTLVVMGALVAGAVVTVASADSSAERARRERKQLVQRLEQIHRIRHNGRVRLNQKIKAIRTELHKGAGPAAVGDMRRWKHNQDHLRLSRKELRKQLKALLRFSERRTQDLRTQRRQLTDWITTYGIFRTCPVAGPVDIADDFGMLVPKRPGTPEHVHQGNDMMASTGTPIVAPFDGVAVATPNRLGGLSVKVYGDLGFVYNAHLSAYGTLGKVRAGTVVGYVGSTGNAGGPHDHFEWHPGDGSAVDPNPYLMAVC